MGARMCLTGALGAFQYKPAGLAAFDQQPAGVHGAFLLRLTHIKLKPYFANEGRTFSTHWQVEAPLHLTNIIEYHHISSTFIYKLLAD